MGSKSSSGSLVKSVESMLPKGVNLKHVLLAVLVGLLLCMMFSQNVEGLKMITGDESSGWSLSTTDVNGYCSSEGIQRRGCVKDEFKKADGTAEETAANVLKADAICGSTGINGVQDNGCVGDSNDTSAGTGLLISNALAADSAVKGHRLSCKVDETKIIDDCSPLDSESQCNSDIGQSRMCRWNPCSFTSADTFKMGADDPNPENASIDLDMINPMTTEYERWNRCVFDNQGQYLTHKLAPKTKVGNVEFSASLKAPTSTPSKHTNIVKLSTGKNPSTGKDVTGLNGWLLGRPGIPRSKMKDGTPVTDSEMRNRNVIPMTKTGEVTADAQKILPQPWIQGLANMWKYCEEGAGTNNKVMLGWSPDLRSVQCLNYNPSLESRSITRKKATYSCECGSPGCTDANGDFDSSMTTSEPASPIASINSNCGLGDKIGSVATAATIHAAQRAVEGTKDAVIAAAHLVSQLPS